MKCSLSLTHDCNMACNYCYAGVKNSEVMDIEIAKKIIDFIFKTIPKDQSIEINYFGGEPFLEFDLIREITKYVRKIEQKYKNPVMIGITSNGTLLTSEILDYLKHERISLCVSIDGNQQVHDRNRKFSSGKGSFSLVNEKLDLALSILDYVQVNAVYGPDTVDKLLETVSFLSEKNVSSIHLNPNITAQWSNDYYPILRKKFQEIADYYISSYTNGQEIAINYIDNKIIIFLKGGYSDFDKCHMGELEWGFAPSGNIYPCERLVGDDNNESFCMGNTQTGLNVDRQSTILWSKNQMGNLKCRNCELQQYCMNWCGCTNYFMTGKTNQTGEFMCANERAAIEAARRVLISLKDNPLFIDHFYQYLQRK